MKRYTGKCKVKDCRELARSKGMCLTCYSRMYKREHRVRLKLQAIRRELSCGKDVDNQRLASKLQNI